MFRHRGQIFPTSSPIFLGSSDSEKETSERPYPNIGPSAWENAEERRRRSVGMFPTEDGIGRAGGFSSPDKPVPESIYLRDEDTQDDIFTPDREKEFKPSDSSDKRKITVNICAPSNTPNPNSLVPGGSRNYSQSCYQSLSPLPIQQDVPCNSPMQPRRSLSSSFSGDQP